MESQRNDALQQVYLGGTSVVGVADSGAQLRITPETVPVSFGDGTAGGQEFEVTFINGSAPLPAETFVYFRINYWAAIPVPGDLPDDLDTTLFLGVQTGQPDAPNHVALGENASSAVLELEETMLVNLQRRVAPVRVAEGTVQPGECFTVCFTNAFSAARHPWGFATDANEHAFAGVIGHPLGAGEDGETTYDYELVSQVAGGWMQPLDAATVHVVAPSRAVPGESFTVRLSVLDAADNLVPGWSGELRISCSDPRAEIEPRVVRLEGGEGGVASLRATLHGEGVHRFSVAGLGRSFASDPVEVGPPRSYRVFWGDYHSHSWRCDGTGDPGVLLTYAQYGAALDWYALTSHDSPPWPLAGAMRWDDLAARVNHANQEAGADRFVTIPAFEWTSKATGESSDGGGDASASSAAGAQAAAEPRTNADGHHIVLARRWETLLDPYLPSCTDERTDTTWKLHRELIDQRQQNAGGPAEFLVVPHDLLCSNWWHINAQHDADSGLEEVSADKQQKYAPLAQVYSLLHGNHESPQEDGTVRGEGCDDWRPHSGFFGRPAELAGYVNGLKYGGIYGVVAGGDSHSGRPGSFAFGALTAVLAADHTRDAIFDALLARHTYATSGYRLILEFTSPVPDAEPAMLGDVVRFPATAGWIPEVRFRVVSPTPLRRVRVVRVRGPEPGETLEQSMDSPTLAQDAWKFVEYVHDVSYTGRRRPGEAEGTVRDGGFRAELWPYASYFLVVSHDNERGRHGKDWHGGNEEERGWTSPIFFRRQP